MQTIEAKIISRIYGHGRGWVFSKIDLVDLGGSGTIDSALSRLNERGTIRRIVPGLYDYPRYSALLDQRVAPDIQKVAQALARKHKWHIVPEGSTALHLLGLSAQVPAQYVFMSSGPNRTFDVMEMRLVFQHRKTQHTVFKHSASAMTVQALQSIGERRLTGQQKKYLSGLFSPEEYRQIVRDTVSVTTWIHDYIKEIAELSATRDFRG